MKKNNLMTLSSFEHNYKFVRHEKEQILMQIKIIHFTYHHFLWVCIACPHVKVGIFYTGYTHNIID